MNWDFSVVWDNFGALEVAFYKTLYISFASIFIGTILGIFFALCSILRPIWIKVISRTMVECFLALPSLVLIIWIYYCLPLIDPIFTLSGEMAAILGLGLSLSAFVAEIIRAGINSVPSGQMEVAYCLGFTHSQAIRNILLPQAIRQMWPPLMSQYITCYQFSTLASIVTVQELLHTGNNIIMQTFRPLEIYTAIAIIFILTIVPLNILARRLERPEFVRGTISL